MSDPKVYEIKSVNDFLAVPVDRMPVCLREFALWIAVNHTVMAAAKAFGGVATPADIYEWTDDDKGDCTLVMSTADEELLRHTFSMKDGQP